MKCNRHKLLNNCLIPLALVAITLALLGCNTTEGVGKDIEATGDAIKDAARDAKD